MPRRPYPDVRCRRCGDTKGPFIGRSHRPLCETCANEAPQTPPNRRTT